MRPRHKTEVTARARKRERDMRMRIDLQVEVCPVVKMFYGVVYMEADKEGLCWVMKKAWIGFIVGESEKESVC